MKKTVGLAVSICLLLGAFTGCTSEVKHLSGPVGVIQTTETPADSTITVYASFYPMYDFANKIGGDKIELLLMAPANSDPHDWEPSPAMIVGLEKADVFIYNGLGMEHWADITIASIDNRDLVIVEAAAGTVALEDDHDDGHGGHDTHVWLDPMQAKRQMSAICDALAQADPQSEDFYISNYEHYAAELDKLDAEFRETLSALPNRSIVVAHEAFGYLCEAYGLTQVGISGLQPDVEPSPARMAQIIEFVGENNISVIFFEELASPKVAEAVARETGAKVAVLNPLEGLTDAELMNGDDYFSVMLKNLEALKDALK